MGNISETVARTDTNAEKLDTRLLQMIEAGVSGSGRTINDVAVVTPAVIDLRGAPKGFVILLSGGGTADYQPCAADGTVEAGTVATAAVSGTVVETPWPYVLVTAAVAACRVGVV